MTYRSIINQFIVDYKRKYIYYPSNGDITGNGKIENSRG